jgi:hypothetical protein
MGSVISLVTQAINFGKQAKAEADREKNRKLSKDAEKLSNPIKPPQAWPTLAARAKNTPTGPYSIAGVRESLENLVLPTGWSEEQLANVGFEPEVRKYQAGVSAERLALLTSFSKVLSALADAVNTELTGDDLKLRKALSRAGVTGAVVNRFNALAKAAASGKLEAAGVGSAISELRGLLDKTQLEKEVSDGLVEARKQRATASDARDGAMLGLLRRALGVRASTAQS